MLNPDPEPDSEQNRNALRFRFRYRQGKKFVIPVPQRCYLNVFQQCCGSGMFIPDPGSEFFPSWIPYPPERI
jgi:hypothetical protein